MVAHRMPRVALLLLAAVLLLVGGAQARRNGAPICGHTPGHGELKAGTNSYAVTVDASEYVPGASTPIRVEVLGSNNFRGFFLSATGADGKRAGTFVEPAGGADALAKFSVCDTPSEALTHTHNLDKKSVVVQWVPPAAGAGDVTFTATVVPVVNDYYFIDSTPLPQTVLNVAPEAPSAPMLVVTGVDSLQIRWQAPANNGPAITQYVVEVDGTEAATLDLVANPDSLLVATISGLAEGTSFNVRVRADNSVGSSPYSGVTAMSTVFSTSTVPPKPSAPSVSNVTATSVDVAWTAAATDVSGIPITGYEVSVGEVTDADSAVPGAYITFEVVYSGSDLSTSVSGLTPSAMYMIRVQALNALGASEASVATEVTMLAGGVCPNDCSNVGVCAVTGQCFCPESRAGADCSISTHSTCFDDRAYCLSWAFEGDDVHVTMAARTSGWVGLIVNPDDGAMTNGDAIIGWVIPGGETALRDSYAEGYALPLEDADLGGNAADADSDGSGVADFRDVRGVRNSTHIVIGFTRKQVTGDAYDSDITATETKIAWAYAANGSPTLAHHGVNHRGSAVVDFSSGSSTETRNNVALVHGIIMLTAWGVCAPLGYAMAYMARIKAQTGTGFFKNPAMAALFKRHRAIQVAAVLLTITGAIVMFVGGRQGFDTGHAVAGLVLLTGCVVQATLGFMFHGDGAHTAHRRLGKTLMALASLVQLPTGFNLIGWGAAATTIWIVYAVLGSVALLMWRFRADANRIGFVSAQDAAANAATAAHTSAPGYVRFALGVDSVIRKQFYHLGEWVSKNRCFTIGMSILVALVCASGLMMLHEEAAIDVVWVPDSTRAVQTFRTVEAQYKPLLSHGVEFVIEAPTPGDNVFTKEILEDLFRFQRYVENMVVEVEALDNQPVTLIDVCQTWYGNSGCRINSPLDYWRNQVHMLYRDDDIGTTAMQTGLQNSIGTETGFDSVFGNPTVSDDGTRLEAASAIMISYSLKYRDPAAEAWQRAVLDAVYEWPQDLYTIHPETAAGWDDELAKAVQGDLTLFLMVLVSMGAFAMLSIGRPHPVQSRLMLGGGAVFSVVMAMLGGYGVASAAGLVFASVHGVLPFVVLGVGLDDAYVILNAVPWDKLQTPHRSAAQWSTHAAVARALSEGGPAIACTSATSIAAFLAGSFSSIPAVSSFCLYAALCILGDLILQVTLFVGILSYDIDRQREGRIDCLPCVRSRTHDYALAAGREDGAADADADASAAADAIASDTAPALSAFVKGAAVVTPYGAAVVESTRKADDVVVVRLAWGTAFMQRASVVLGNERTAAAVARGSAVPIPGSFGSAMASDAGSSVGTPHPAMVRFYTSFLGTKGRRYATMAAFVVFFGICLGFMTQLKSTFKGRDVVRDDSYLIGHLDATDLHWVHDEYGHMVIFGEFDYADPANQAAILDTQDAFKATTSLELQSWYDEFLEYVRDEYTDMLVPAPGRPSDLVPSADNFYGLLGEFLDAPILGDAYVKFLLFDRPVDQCLAGGAAAFPCTLVSSSMYLETVYTRDSVERTREMHEQRRIADTSAVPCDVFDTDHLTLELNEVVQPQLVQNLVLAVVAVTIVGGAFMVHPQPLAVAFVSLVMIDIEIIGLMSMVGIPSSPIALVFLIMSIGLSWDTQSHCIHAYLSCSGDRVQRTINAISGIGPAVLKGAGSTLVGLMFIAAAGSNIFRVMFMLFVSVVLLSVAHGFLLIPAVLATWGTNMVNLSHGAGAAKPLLQHANPAVGKSVTPSSVKVVSTRANGHAASAASGAGATGVEMTPIAPTSAAAAASRAAQSTKVLGASPRPAAPRDAPVSGAERCCQAVYLVLVTILAAALIYVTLLGTGAIEVKPRQTTGALVTERDIVFPVNETLELKMPGHVLPSDRTSYACSGFTLPMDAMRHATDFEVIVDFDFPEGTVEEYSPVHHIIVFSCFGKQPEEPIECWTMPDECTQILFAWGVGIEKFHYPPEAGMAVGKGTENTYVSMQMHYDNYMEVEGIVDRSGIRASLTSDLRTYDAGVFATGSRIELLTVPPLQPAHQVKTVCPPQPTSDCPFCKPDHLDEFLDGDTLTVFAYAVHGHQLARAIWTDHWSADGTYLGQLGVDMAYNFETQRILPFEGGNRFIRPGDRFETHCIYDSSDKEEVTEGGDETRDEMCLSFFLYFPKPASVVKDPSLGWCLSDSEPVLSLEQQAP